MFDIVVYGATGFTESSRVEVTQDLTCVQGRLVARYLAKQEGVSFSIAGRSLSKLKAVVQEDKLPSSVGVRGSQYSAETGQIEVVDFDSRIKRSSFSHCARSPNESHHLDGRPLCASWLHLVFYVRDERCHLLGPDRRANLGGGDAL